MDVNGVYKPTIIQRFWFKTSISLKFLALTFGKPADWGSKICGDLKQLHHRWSEAILKR